MSSLQQDHEDHLRAYTDAVMVWLGIGPRIVSLTADYMRQQTMDEPTSRLGGIVAATRATTCTTRSIGT